MSQSFFAVIPAAGTGTRFGTGVPKQYLPLNGLPLIRYTLAALLSDMRVCRLLIVLSATDQRWDDNCMPSGGAGRIQVIREGGETRAESVKNGINWLKKNANVSDQDWVLVHDAARPCLLPSQLRSLLDELVDDPVGGLLAIRVADTLKRSDHQGRIEQTADRQDLWQAQTPQMFRLGVLQKALSTADVSLVTDEASAIEQIGLRPKLVMGSVTNLKVTYPEDLLLAELILASTNLQRDPK